MLGPSTSMLRDVTSTGLNVHATAVPGPFLHNLFGPAHFLKTRYSPAERRMATTTDRALLSESGGSSHEILDVLGARKLMHRLGLLGQTQRRDLTSSDTGAGAGCATVDVDGVVQVDGCAEATADATTMTVDVSDSKGTVSTSSVDLSLDASRPSVVVDFGSTFYMDIRAGTKGDASFAVAENVSASETWRVDDAIQVPQRHCN